MTEITPATDFNEIVPIIDRKWESDSENIRKDRLWLTEKACQRIKEMCKKNMKKNYNEEGKLSDEIVFHWYNVRNDLLKYCQEDIDNNKMKFSFDTIFKGGFISPKTKKINRQRVRDAGVTNPFVLDVKRAISDSCIKVWDVSDKEKSKTDVWEVTIFIHEIRKKGDKKADLEV